MPWPKTAPPEIRVLPWRTMLVAVGFSPLVVKTRLSIDRYEMPEAVRDAPPVAEELSQPRPVPEGGFPHGQAITPLAAGSHRLVNAAASRSRTKTSWTAFVSFGTRLVASAANATKRPVADIAWKLQRLLAWLPAESRLTRNVLPVCMSWTKTSRAAFVSPATRFVA